MNYYDESTTSYAPYMGGMGGYDVSSSVPSMGFGSTQRRQPAMAYDQNIMPPMAGPSIGQGAQMQSPMAPPSQMSMSPMTSIQSQIPPPGGGTLGSAGNLPPALQSWLRKFY